MPPPRILPSSEPAASLVPLPNRLPMIEPAPEPEPPSSDPNNEPIPPELPWFCCPNSESRSGASCSRIDIVCPFSIPAFFESAETVLFVFSPKRCCKIFALSLESTLPRKDFTSVASLAAWSDNACVSACSPFFVLAFCCMPSSISGNAAPMTDSTCDCFAPLFLLSALTASLPRMVSSRVSVWFIRFSLSIADNRLLEQSIPVFRHKCCDIVSNSPTNAMKPRFSQFQWIFFHSYS